MKYVRICDTVIGEICLVQEGDAIVTLGIAGSRSAKDTVFEETPLLRQAVLQIEEYLAGERREFDIRVRTAGTPFQEKVWRALREIPYGETRTYGQIAAKIGCPRGARAVGMACNRNPIMLLIPCHRVLGSDGSLTGFAGGLPVKEKLLRLEATAMGRRPGSGPG